MHLCPRNSSSYSELPAICESFYQQESALDKGDKSTGNRVQKQAAVLIHIRFIRRKTHLQRQQSLSLIVRPKMSCQEPDHTSCEE